MIRCCLLALALSAAATPVASQVVFRPAAAGEDRATAREVERAIRAAQDRVNRIYLESGALHPPGSKGICSGETERDCFFADRECTHCIWDDDAPFLDLASFYEEIAPIVLRAPGGVRAQLLNWYAGQRVGILVRLGRYDRARTAADECLADLWWCEALTGLVLHRLGDIAAADSVFRNVMRLAPPRTACMWNDIAALRDSTAPALAFSMPDSCFSFDQLRWFWTLSDPLFSVPGNARMTEHYARQVDLHISRHFLDRMRSDGLDGSFARRFGYTLRHGWPTGHGNSGVAVIAPTHASRPGTSSFRDWARAATAVRGAPGQLLTFGHPAGQGFIVGLQPDDALVATARHYRPRDRPDHES